MKYRMYIDEVGSASMKGPLEGKNRYLSLTGIIMELGHVDGVAAPAVEALKRRHFKTHVDDPIIFHRRELAGRLYPFKELMDSVAEQRFNTDLLEMMNSLEYTVCTVAIDKLQHEERYKVWRFDPYHYCLLILVERLVLWLEGKGAGDSGDVLAEARGGKEDRRLKDSFERVYENGSDYITANRIQERLTSRQLKVKTKSSNIAGLQIADLIANPSFLAMQARREKQALPSNFGGKIVSILEKSKYYRDNRGSIDGVGRKWLP